MDEDKKQSQKQFIPWWRKKRHTKSDSGGTKINPRPQKQVEPKKPNNYAFIDSQNLNLGVQKSGWKMDWRKFRDWLRSEHHVTHAYMFIGYMSENEELYKQMHEHGFLVVLKPTNEIMIVEKPGEKREEEKEKAPVKGNIDADLVLYAMKELPNYDKAIIVSNDGDFFSLLEYLKQQGKLLKLMTPNHRYSMLLKPFENEILNLENFRKVLAYRHFGKVRQQSRTQ